MELGVIERSIVGGLLAVVNFLQFEQSISHPLHIVITCVSIFLATVFVIPRKGETVIDEPAPGTVDLPMKDEVDSPRVSRAKL